MRQIYWLHYTNAMYAMFSTGWNASLVASACSHTSTRFRRWCWPWTVAGRPGRDISTVDVAGQWRLLAFGSRSLSPSDRNIVSCKRNPRLLCLVVSASINICMVGVILLFTRHYKTFFSQKGRNSVTTASKLVRYAVFLCAYNYRLNIRRAKKTPSRIFFQATLKQRDPTY